MNSFTIKPIDKHLLINNNNYVIVTFSPFPLGGVGLDTETTGTYKRLDN